MAAIWMSNGNVGPGSTGPAIDLDLKLIDERLSGSGHKVHFQGEDPKHIAPATTYLTHVVVEVSGIDEPTAHFDRPGFYRVLGLHAEDAGFLIAPPPGTVLR
jgi:hypothetical protein